VDNVDGVVDAVLLIVVGDGDVDVTEVDVEVDAMVEEEAVDVVASSMQHRPLYETASPSQASPILAEKNGWELPICE
jgi:hypothetical protein